MADEDEIRCHYQHGVVTLTCGEEAFARLWAEVAAAAWPTVATPPAVTMVVFKRPAPDRPPTPWLDGLGYLGCGVVAVAAIVLLGTETYKVSRWLWSPRRRTRRCSNGPGPPLPLRDFIAHSAGLAAELGRSYGHFSSAEAAGTRRNPVSQL